MICGGGGGCTLPLRLSIHRLQRGFSAMTAVSKKTSTKPGPARGTDGCKSMGPKASNEPAGVVNDSDHESACLPVNSTMNTNWRDISMMKNWLPKANRHVLILNLFP